MTELLAPAAAVLDTSLAQLDPEVAAALDAELARQRGTLEMIASENFAPLAVMEAQGPSSPTSTPRATPDGATTAAASTSTSSSSSPSTG